MEELRGLPVVNALNENNLEICGYHTPWAFVQDGFLNAWIAYCKAIGNKYVVIPGLPEECSNSISAWRETTKAFNCIAAKLAKEGMRLGYHNHSAEFMPMEGQIPWDAFYEAALPEIIAQFDIGNSLSGTGIDAMKYHEKYINRGATIHAKAFAADGRNAAIGEDDLDWVKYVNTVKEAGVTDYCIVEYEHVCDDLYDKLKICYNTLNKLFLS